MPFRRTTRHVPYAIPPKRTHRKFKLVTPWIPPTAGIGFDSFTTAVLNNPRNCVPYFNGGNPPAGGQPPAFDFWVGTPLGNGPYPIGVCYYVKIKTSVLYRCDLPDNNVSRPGILSFVDSNISPFQPSGYTPTLLKQRPGTIYREFSQDLNPNVGDLDNVYGATRSYTISRKMNVRNWLGFDTIADMFQAQAAVSPQFGANSDPTLFVRNYFVPYDAISDIFLPGGTTGLYVKHHFTFYCALRLREADFFRDRATTLLLEQEPLNAAALAAAYDRATDTTDASNSSSNQQQQPMD